MTDDQALEALKSFKDWSNYLLVTSVAALGWVATRNADLPEWAFVMTVALLAGSVVFAIFTLAFIPLAAEKTDAAHSFYSAKPEFRPIPLLPKVNTLTIKWVCWPQHVLFIFGIVTFAVGSIQRCGGGAVCDCVLG